jgi:tRNA pseudouridine-54 N-methylase
MMSSILESARSNVRMIEATLASMPGDSKLINMLGQAKANLSSIEQSLGLTASQSLAGQAPQQSQGPTVEQRLAALEGTMQQVIKAAAPVINEAAQQGAAIMAALGQAMSPEQTKFVQERLQTSPEFFASDSCRAAIDIFIHEWKAFEGGNAQ